MVRCLAIHISEVLDHKCVRSLALNRSLVHLRGLLLPCRLAHVLALPQSQVLMAEFGIVEFHGKLSSSQKTTRLRMLKEGMCLVAVGTDSMVHGLDADIGSCIFAGQPRDPFTLYQGAARAGRRGRVGKIHVFVQLSRFSAMTDRLLDGAIDSDADVREKADLDMEDLRSMLAMTLNEHKCRHSHFASYFGSGGGGNIRCDPLGAAVCDCCTAINVANKAQRKDKIVAVKLSSAQINALRKGLSQHFKGGGLEKVGAGEVEIQKCISKVLSTTSILKTFKGRLTRGSPRRAATNKQLGTRFFWHPCGCRRSCIPTCIQRTRGR